MSVLTSNRDFGEYVSTLLGVANSTVDSKFCEDAVLESCLSGELGIP